MFFPARFAPFGVFLQIRKHLSMLMKQRLSISAFWVSLLVVWSVSLELLLGISFIIETGGFIISTILKK